MHSNTETFKIPRQSILFVIKKLLRFSPMHKWFLPFLVILGLAAAFAEGLGVSLLVLFLYSTIGRGTDIAATGGIIGQFFAAISSEIGGGTSVIISIVGLIGINIGLTYAYTLITAHARYRLSESIRNRLGAQFLEISYDFILRHDQGQLLNVWAGESWLMGEMYLCVGRFLINACSSVIFTLFLLFVSWKLLLVAAIGITLLLTAMYCLSEPARDFGRRMRKQHENIAERMLVTLQGMRSLRAFAQEQRYQQGFEAASADVRRTSIAFERLHALVSPAVELGNLLLLVAIILVSDPMGVSFAATLAFVALLYRLQPRVRELQSNFLSIAQLEASATSVIRMLDRSDKTYLTPGTASFTGLRREIRFESVSFAYTGASSPTLDQISFTIPAGSVTALVGISGAGKTTIVNLLLRLYRQDSGSVLVDGIGLDELSREGWLSRIAIAGQDVELIEGTVQENLRVAAPQADLAAMRAAAKTAGILDSIEHLPQGFNSWIGQQGLQLSGGQRQRLELARALLRNPDILILDEATNALNGGLESEILDAIRQKLAGRTLLVITHRLDIAMSADHVICIGSGRVLESGSPAKLLTRPASVFSALLRDIREDREVVTPLGE